MDVYAVSVVVAELDVSAHYRTSGGEVFFSLVEIIVVVALSLRAPVNAMVEVT